MESAIFGGWGTPSRIAARAKRILRGVSHRNRIVPRDPLPGQAVEVMVSVGGTHDRVSLYYTTDGTTPQGRRGRASNSEVVAMAQEGKCWNDLLWGYVNWYRGIIPPQGEGVKVKYKIEAWHSNGQDSLYADNQATDSGSATLFAYRVDQLTLPQWARDAIIYQIFVDRFYPGDSSPHFKEPDSPSGFYGGTLQGIIDKLDYFTDLGVNCLWLSPCFSSPSHHGYDITDNLTVEPRLGSNDDLRRLTQLAHEGGLRVILDFVPNHTSSEHPFFLQAQADRASPYYDWYTFTEWPDEYATFFGERTLPQLNNEHEPTRRYIIDEVAARWLSDYRVDGFRLDYVPGPSHNFWVDFFERTKEVAPDCLSIGEVIGNADSMRSYEGRLDGFLDFLFMQAAREFFALKARTVEEFDSFITHHESYFSKESLRPTFLDNHDANRFLWLANGDKRRLKLAALCQFTLPHPPIIYYGTEVGLSQDRDVRMPSGHDHLEYARMPMLWGEDQHGDLYEYYRRLCRIRSSHPALRKGERTTLHVDNDAGTYAYALRTRGEVLVVVLNNSDEVSRLSVPVGSVGLADGMVAADLMTGDRYVVAEGQVQLSLEPLTGTILRCSNPHFGAQS